MSAKKLLALWGLKWNPFTPELPHDALFVTARRSKASPGVSSNWCRKGASP